MTKLEFGARGMSRGRTRHPGVANDRAGAEPSHSLAATAGEIHRRPGPRQRAGHRRAAVRRSAVQALGPAVVIENKPGADGINAINAFVGAHDTHTLLFAASGTFTAHPTQYAKLPYDPSDLVPLARVSSTIIAVPVPTALNVNTLDELVALARKEPGKFNLAPTPGTTEITFDNFLKTASITMTKIPYSDVTKALADLSENRVQVIVSGIAIVKSQVDAGKVKLLAITNLKRAAAVPDLPTAIEAGYPSLALDGFIGLFGPRNLPPGTAERIAADVQAVAADPAHRARLAATGQQLDPGGTAEFAPRWRRSAATSQPPPRHWASSQCGRRPHHISHARPTV